MFTLLLIYSKGKNKERCVLCGKCPNEIKTVLRQMAPGFNVQQQEEVPSKHRCKEEKTTLNAYVLFCSVYDLSLSSLL